MCNGMIKMPEVLVVHVKLYSICDDSAARAELITLNSQNPKLTQILCFNNFIMSRLQVKIVNTWLVRALVRIFVERNAE